MAATLERQVEEAYAQELTFDSPSTWDISPSTKLYASNINAIHNVAVEHVAPVQDNYTKIDTAKDNEAIDLKTSANTVNKIWTKTKLNVEADYYGVINQIDHVNKTLSAFIYDKADKVMLMEVDIPFSEFQESDHALFKESSVFYWQIGKKSEYIINKRGLVKKTQTNFSSFRMRRLFVDMKKQDKRISTLSNKYKNIFKKN